MNAADWFWYVWPILGRHDSRAMYEAFNLRGLDGAKIWFQEWFGEGAA